MLFGAHQEHDTGILPLLLADVDGAGPLEEQRIIHILLRQVADSDRLQVVVEGFVRLFKL